MNAPSREHRPGSPAYALSGERDRAPVARRAYRHLLPPIDGFDHFL